MHISDFTRYKPTEPQTVLYKKQHVMNNVAALSGET